MRLGGTFAWESESTIGIFQGTPPNDLKSDPSTSVPRTSIMELSTEDIRFKGRKPGLLPTPKGWGATETGRANPTRPNPRQAPSAAAKLR